jgi:hypothetical protein
MTPISTTIAAGATLDITTMPQGGRVTISHSGYLRLTELVNSTNVPRYSSSNPGIVTLDVVNATWQAINDGATTLEISIEEAITEILGTPSVARQLAAGAATANTALTSTVRRISMRAVGANIRFAIGSGAQTANADTSHFIADGERLDFAVPAASQIAVIRDASTDGVLEVTELV